MSESDSSAWSVVLSQTDQSGLAYAHQKPKDVEELKALLIAAKKNNTAVVLGGPQRIPPQTELRSLVFADLALIDQVLEYSVADQVIEVSTGIRLGVLRKLLSANNQWWPIYAPDDWTLLDAVNGGDSGAIEHRFPALRDLILGCQVLTADGTMLKCGGKVVKNVSGYDMTKLFIGARGTLGAVISAQLRLYALPESSCSLKWSFASCVEAFAFSQALTKSGLPLSAVTVVSRVALNNLTTVTQPWSVLAQVKGGAAVTGEVVAAANRIRPADQAASSGPEDQLLWEGLTAQFARLDDGSCLKFASGSKNVCALADQLATFGPVEFRPLSGRATVKSLEVKALLDLLGKQASVSAPVVVACADDKYNYRLHRFPAPAVAFSGLQARIKHEFDRAAILNPLAKL